LSNALVHNAIGVSSAVIGGSQLYQINTDEEEETTPGEYTIGCGAGGFAGARIPDKLEPAHRPNHRSFFHSILFGAVLVGGLTVAYKGILKPTFENYNQKNNESKKSFFDFDKADYQEILRLSLCCAIAGLIISVLSHLIADSTTPAGLPLVS